MKSRKRGLTYIFTSQVMSQLNKRVRTILDFLSYPIMTADEHACKMSVFRGGSASQGTYMKTFYFKTALFFDLYNTNEEVEPMKEKSDVPFKPVFQPNYNPEHGYCCECAECGTKVFETWEEADKFSEQYWQENIKSLKSLI